MTRKKAATKKVVKKVAKTIAKKTVKKSAAKKPPAKKPAAKLEILASKAWPRTAAALCRKAAQTALDVCALRQDVEVSILLTTDSAVRKLNAQFRGKDKPTNVLSFPADPEDTFPGEPQILGDIAIAYGVCAKEAKDEDKTFHDHLTHLVVHGVLHLLGYDHEKGKEADTMEEWERKILARLGIADPYADTVLEKMPAKSVRTKPARSAPKARRKTRSKR
jgi:probable rRNA maturation factor